MYDTAKLIDYDSEYERSFSTGYASNDNITNDDNYGPKFSKIY